MIECKELSNAQPDGQAAARAVRLRVELEYNVFYRSISNLPNKVLPRPQLEVKFCLVLTSAETTRSSMSGHRAGIPDDETWKGIEDFVAQLNASLWRDRAEGWMQCLEGRQDCVHSRWGQ